MAKENILIVDDEKNIRRTLGLVLEGEGYEVHSVGKAEEGLDHLEKEGADLMILDMIMPGMDGNQTFDRLREIRPELPVLLSSGYAINGQAIDIMQKGCNGFIQKPFSFEELLARMRAHARRGAMSGDAADTTFEEAMTKDVTSFGPDTGLETIEVDLPAVVTGPLSPAQQTSLINLIRRAARTSSAVPSWSSWHRK